MANNRVRRNGSYAPLSAHYYKDDRIDAAGIKAELLFVRGLAWCADVLSDGFVSDSALARFVGAGIPKATELARRLDQVGLWIRDDDHDGYWVKSWEKWNLTKAEIDDKLRADTARKAAGQ